MRVGRLLAQTSEQGRDCVGGRRSQHRGKAADRPTSELLDEILSDVIATIDLPDDEWRQLWQSPFVPMAIPTPDRRQYRCTQAAIDAAHTLTTQTWNARPDMRATFTRTQFDRISFAAIGQAITDLPTHLPEGGAADEEIGDRHYEAMGGDYVASLERDAGKVRLDMDRHIPCDLFRGDHGVRPFSVGPVCFRPRADWIARYITEPPVLEIISAYDRGEMTRDELRRRMREEPDDMGESEAIATLDFLGAHSWVATVRINGHEPNKSHEKASVIVGLAIDAIGLRFDLHEARAFTKAGRQHLFNEARLGSTTSGGFLRGWSAARAGIGRKPGTLAARMAAEQRWLDAAGTLLEAYLNDRDKGKAHHFLERWANALYWFGEGRREASDFMAVVDYGCAADGISGAGGNVNPMIEFAEALLRPSKASAGTTGTTGIGDAVRRVYADGRNKLAHGEESGLLEDHSETRTLGDNLMAAILVEITPVLAELISKRDRILEVSETHGYKALVIRLKTRH